MTMRKNLDSIKNILFDLDGTLTDSSEGIVRCLQYAFEQLSIECPSPAELHAHIGPPVRNALSLMMKTEDTSLIEEALRLYRVRFSETGIYENRVYEGIPETLTALRASSKRLFVATSKPLVFTERILNHFRMTDYFDRVFGSELSGKLDNKVELISHVLSNATLAPDETLMVGDRMYDIFGAKENGCLSIGVTYGFGSEEELRNAGADLICQSPLEIAGQFHAE